MRNFLRQSALGLLVALGIGTLAAAAEPEPAPKVGEKLPRRGDEIVVCGQLFHTTAPVVLWMDPDGYDAYRVGRRFGPTGSDSASSKTKAEPEPSIGFGPRRVALSPEERERARHGGWDLDTLRKVVDQFVIHYDVEGTSQNCFRVLHDLRGLSVQFMLDLDGTIYQTLDLKEGAWHATKANGRSIGIEIANVGAYSSREPAPFARWFQRDPDGRTRIVLDPARAHSIRKLRAQPDWVPRPIRSEPVTGPIRDRQLTQYDLTPEQYDSLIRLTATLCTVFPKIKCDYPRDASGKLIRATLPGDQYDKYEGILGHYHVQDNKTDPGPAFQWDRVIDGARALMAR
jgi:N-acetyl-anhydromuramyl-L-alanine amidase AmpD